MPKHLTLLCALLIFLLPCLPAEASAPPQKYAPSWLTKWVAKKVQKRQARLQRKIARTDNPKKIARLKKKSEEITTFDVVVFFIAVLAGLLGLVGLALKAEGFYTVCFVIMLAGFAILFRRLFKR